MDHKRKTSASNGGGAAAGDDRAAKRRKGPADFPNLMTRETNGSTTAYGLAFLEQIRRTADKHGRPVAGYFEKLLPREGNEDYYKKIRMPISLLMIERKLENLEFGNMSELESYFKRMVNNAKEFYPRNSTTFEDAERVRKATSNYMTKTNPAYKLVTGYTAMPTPIPPDYDVNAELRAQDGPRSEAGALPVEEDAEGDDDMDVDADADADADEEDDRDIQPEPTTRIVLKRRGGRPPSESTETPSSAGGKADNDEYANVPYQGLTFQQAQEKIVDALIKRTDGEDDWAYFEPFLNLPPRTLKDYYQLIEEPLSLKKLQRLVRGMHGRGGATGVSDFKSWAAFEQKASLLWENAMYYNEDGSEISELAQELKDAFLEQLQEAKACVEEPAQPKIKLRAPSAQAPVAPTRGPKKITIHVGGRDGSQGSPAPTTARLGDSSLAHAPSNGSVPHNPFVVAAVSVNQLDKARSMSASGAASPSPSSGVKHEDPSRQSPAVGPVIAPRPNGMSPNAFQPPLSAYTQGGFGGQPRPQIHPQARHLPQPPVMTNGHPMAQNHHPGPSFDVKHRAPGRGVSDALLANLCVRTPLDNNSERRLVLNVPPHPNLYQQSVTVSLASNQWKLHIVPRISPALEAQHRAYKMFILVNGQTLGRSVPQPRDPIEGGGMLYEAQLHTGVNTIVVQIIAALPKGEKLPNGCEVELEKITILANVPRKY